MAFQGEFAFVKSTKGKKKKKKQPTSRPSPTFRGEVATVQQATGRRPTGVSAPAPAVRSPVRLTSTKPSPVMNRIASIERSSARSLPTSVTMALTNSRLEGSELERASQMLSRRFDLEADWYFEPLGMNKVRDPVTGEEMTLQTARRLLKPQEAGIIEQILKGQAMLSNKERKQFRARARAEGTTPAEMGPEERPLRAKRIARVMSALATIPGEFPFADAMAIAVEVASTPALDPDLFEGNLRTAVRLKNLGPHRAASTAWAAADRNIAFRDTEQVAMFLSPPEAKEAIEAAQYRRDVLEGRDLDLPGLGELGLSEETIRAQETLRIQQEMQLEQPLAAGGIAAASLASMGQNFLDAVERGEEDFFATRDRLQNEMEMNREMMADGPIGKVFGGILKGLEYVFRPIEAAGRLAGGAALGITEGLDEERLTEIGRDTLDILHGRTTFGEETVVKDMGLPKWTAPIADLALGVALDPLIVGGRLAKLRYLNRTRFIMERKGTAAWMDLADDLVLKPHAWTVPQKVRVARKQKLSRFLIDEIRRGDPNRFMDKVEILTSHRFGTLGAYRQTYAKVYHDVTEWTRRGVPLDQIERQVDQIFLAGFGGRFSPDSLAVAQADEFRRVERLQTEMALNPDRPKGWDGAEVEIQDALRNAADLDEWRYAIESGLLPQPHGLPGRFTPIRSMQAAVRRRFGDVAGVRFARAAINKPPRGNLVIDVPGADPMGHFRRWSVGVRKFPNAERAQHETTLGRLLQSRRDPDREAKLGAFFDARNRETAERIGAEYGWSPEDAEDILKTSGVIPKTEAQFFGGRPELPLDELAARAGITREEALRQIQRGEMPLVPVRQPLVATQFRNEFQLLDPVLVRRTFREAQGMMNELRNRAMAAFGKQGQAKIAKIPLTRWFLGTKDVVTRKFFLNWWKPLVVVRPAYAMRIPIWDEKFVRVNTTIGVMGSMEASPRGARLIGKTRGAQIAIKGTDETLGLRPMSQIDPELDEIVGVGGIRELVRAGGERASREIETMQRAMRGGRGGVAWAEIGPDDAAWSLRQWEHVLKNQWGQNPVGGKILQSIARGHDEDRTIREVVSWLKGPGRAEADRMMQGTDWVDEALEMRIRDATQIVRYQTGAYADYTDARLIADAAWRGTLDEGLLRSVPDELRPRLNGADIDEILRGNNQLQRAWNKTADVILQQFTNRLNRFNFGRHWASRAEEAMVRVANEQGLLTNPATRETLLKNIRNQARDFAALQSKRILFDFREQSRYMEALSFAIPFFQPFNEAFISYARIIKQNPAILGWVSVAGRAMEDSGFVRRDEDTGVLVVPMHYWMAGVPLLRVLTGVGGWQLSSPLEGFNLFASTAFPFGGVADNPDFFLPSPGLSPPAMKVLQEMLTGDVPGLGWMDPETKSRLASWAFEFGEVNLPDLLPPWLGRFISGIPGMEKFMGDETERNASQFLRVQEMMGVPVVAPDEAPPGYTQQQWNRLGEENPGERQRLWEEHRAEMARESARKFSLARSFINLFFPSAPIIDFPTEELDDEWRALVDQHGGNAFEAQDEWLRRHPDLWSFTISKAPWDADALSPIPVPSTEAVNQLLNHPEIREWAQRNPEWVWALIPREIREGEADLGSYNMQIAQALRTVRSPEETLEQVQIARGWRGYMLLKDQWQAWQDAHPNMSESDPQWRWRYEQYRLGYEDLEENYPSWSVEFRNFEKEGRDKQVMDMARNLAEDEFYTQLEVGKGLQAWIAHHDRIEEKMRKQGITSIDTKYAKEIGLFDEYEKGNRELFERFPDFKIAHNIFFSDALKGVKDATMRALDRMNEVERDQYFDLASEWDTFDFDEMSKLEGLEQDEAWLERRKFVNRVLAEVPKKNNPLYLEWQSMTGADRKARRRGLLRRPMVFWSRFDREVVMGMETSNSAEALWDSYAEARLDISRRREENPEIEAGPLYERLDRQVLEMMNRDPVFRNQVLQANDWGWAGEHVLPYTVNDNNPAQEFWKAWIDGVRQVQEILTKRGLEFLEREPIYHEMIRALKQYRDDVLFQESDSFRRQWEVLEEENQLDDLIFNFIPDPKGQFPYNLPIGGFAAVKLPAPPPWAKPVEATGNVKGAFKGMPGDPDGGNLLAGAKPAGKAHLGGAPLVTYGNVTLAKKAMRSLLKASRILGKQIPVVSGYRSAAEQAALIRANAGTGVPTAPVGSSKHESGTAVDIDTSFVQKNPMIVDILERLGWHRFDPVVEPWHFSYRSVG